MKTTEILVRELNDYFQKKYDSEVIIKYVTFSHSFDFDNRIMNFSGGFEMSVHIDFQTINHISSWNAPRVFKSKISFENACEIAKIALDGFMKSVFYEQDINEDALPNQKIRILLNTPPSQLYLKDFDALISYFIDNENYSKAQEYKLYKEKYFDEE